MSTGEIENYVKIEGFSLEQSTVMPTVFYLRLPGDLMISDDLTVNAADEDVGGYLVTLTLDELKALRAAIT